MKNSQHFRQVQCKQGFIVPLVIAIIAVLAVGGGVYIYSQKKVNVAQNINTITSDWKTYYSDKYKVSLSYPADWKIKEEGAYPGAHIAQTSFYQTDPQKASFTLTIYKKGELRFGTRDWQDVSVGANKFIMSCEKSGPLGGFTTNCEIVPSADGEFAYVLYINNPSIDPISKEILASFQIDKKDVVTQSQAISTINKTKIFKVPELNLEFTVGSDLDDLTYYVETFGDGKKAAYFSTESLSNIGGPNCASKYGSLGALSLYDEDGKYVSTGNYTQPQDSCSASKDVINLQNKLKISFESAIKNRVSNK